MGMFVPQCPPGVGDDLIGYPKILGQWYGVLSPIVPHGWGTPREGILMFYNGGMGIVPRAPSDGGVVMSGVFHSIAKPCPLGPPCPPRARNREQDC